MSVVPRAQEWMAAATGSEVGARWDAVRSASRRRAKLSRGIVGMDDAGDEDVGPEEVAGTRACVEEVEEVR